MAPQNTPLASSANTKTIVPFQDMPEEYVMVDRDNMSRYPHTQELFAANPSAKTLMVLYVKNNGDLRSVYQSPAVFDDEARNYPEKNHEVFYHVSGEKLVNLVLEVACDVSAYGQNNVMVPQGASDEEVRGMAYSRAQSVSNWDNSFGFQEDWSTAEGLRINRVVEVIQEAGKKNLARNVAIAIPVEFAPSRSGLDVFEMLKAAERGAIIPPEVFMYAAARQTQEAGEDFAPEFMENLKSKAMGASENAVYQHMMAETPLSAGMMSVVSGSDVIEYLAGSVLRGTPQDPIEYRVYQDKQDAEHVVLAGVIHSSAISVVLHHNPGIVIEVGEIHAINKSFIGDDYIKPGAFHNRFVALDGADAEIALVKHFGYTLHENSTSQQMLPNEEAEKLRAKHASRTDHGDDYGPRDE